MSLFTKRNINAKKMGHTSQVFMHVCVLFACTQTRLFIFPPFIFSRGTLNKAWLTAPTKHLFCLSTTIKWAFIEHRAETKTSYSKPGFTSQSNPLRARQWDVRLLAFSQCLIWWALKQQPPMLIVFCMGLRFCAY